MKAGFSSPAWRMAKIAAQRTYSRWNTHRKTDDLCQIGVSLATMSVLLIKI